MNFESKKIVYKFLEELEKGEVTTQKELSINLRVSIGYINALIKKFLKKGYIKAKQAPYKRFIYYLTTKGFIEKSKLVSEYINSSLNFFRTLRSEFNKMFVLEKEKNGFVSFVLFGVSEVTEICIISALDNNMKVSYIVDKKFKSKNFLGINVLKNIRKLKQNEKIIITDQDQSQNLYSKLSKNFNEDKLIVIPTLSISKNKPIYDPSSK